MKNEPVSINGVVLTEGQSMALWVAMNSFLMQLGDRGYAADLGHGLAANYLDRTLEVMRLIHPEALPGRVVAIDRGDGG